MDDSQLHQIALEVAAEAVRHEGTKRRLLQGDGGLQGLSDEDHATLARHLDEIAEAVERDVDVAAALAALSDDLLNRRDSIQGNASPRRAGRQLGLEEAAAMVRGFAARLAGGRHADR